MANCLGGVAIYIWNSKIRSDNRLKKREKENQIPDRKIGHDRLWVIVQKKKKCTLRAGKLIASVSAPHCNYSEAPRWFGRRFNFIRRWNMHLSTCGRNIALRPNAESCFLMYTQQMHHWSNAVCAYIYNTQCRTDQRCAAKSIQTHDSKLMRPTRKSQIPRGWMHTVVVLVFSCT